MSYADPRHCPDCGADLPVAPGACPRCRLPLAHPLAAELFVTLTRADQLLAALRVQRDPVPVPAGVVAGPPPRRGVRGATVPQILLGLGALLLLVAALTFLAVAWSWLGVGGRTVVLVAFTGAAGVLSGWFGRRGLRAAAESLSAVAFGLLALDLSGAADAGWLGSLRLVSVIGATLLVVALAVLAVRRPRGAAGHPTGWLAPVIVPEVVAAAGLLMWWADQSDTGWLEGHLAVTASAAAASFVAVGLLARAWGLRTLTVLGLVGVVGWTLLVLVSAVREAAADPSLRGLWLDGGPGWSFLSAAALALAATRLVGARAARDAGLLAASTIVAVAVLVPAADETTTRLALVSAALLAVAALAAGLLPRGAWPVTIPQIVVPLAPVVVIGLAQVAASAERMLPVGMFSAPVGIRLSPMLDRPGQAWVLPVLVAALLLTVVSLARVGWPAWSWGRLARAGAPAGLGILLGSAVLALSWGEVRLAYVAAGLLLTAVVTAGLAWLLREPTSAPGVDAAPWLVAGVAAVSAVVTALPSDTLTAAVVGLLAAAAAGVVVVGRGVVREAGHLALPATAGGFAVALSSVADLGSQWWAVPAIVVVGLLGIARPRPALEVSAAATALVAGIGSGLAASATLSSIAVVLTMAGAVVTASALLHPSRRWLGWPGGLLLAMATWARLADLGVEEPEAYTLPSAAALLAVGLWRLRRDPAASTSFTLTPGLVLATVPSLLWALLDPFGWRGLLLGLGCLLLVVGGVALRWSSPLLVGAVAGLVLAIRLSEPVVSATPTWVLIGVAGTLLTVVGVTWESRLRDARSAAAYLGRLR